MSAEKQATIGDFLQQPSVDRDDTESEDTGVDELAAVFETVTGNVTFTERQEETPSHDPIEGEFDVTVDDGLEDAADSDLQMGGWK